MRLLFAVLAVSSFVLAGGAGSARAQPQALPRSDDPNRVIIFFAWDRPVIDGDAAARLDALAASILGRPTVRLAMSGHADRSGPSLSNLRSGQTRADAVAAYLAQRGVPGAAMTVRSQGEAQPLIPTADGVREPHNRRVEILVERADAD